MSYELRQNRSFIVYDLSDMVIERDLWREFLIVNGRINHDTSESKFIVAGWYTRSLEYNEGSDVEILSYNLQDGTVIITKIPLTQNELYCREEYNLTAYMKGGCIGRYIPGQSMWDCKYRITVINKVLVIAGKKYSDRYEVIIPRSFQSHEEVRIHQVRFPGKGDACQEIWDIMEKLTKMHGVNEHDIETLFSYLPAIDIVFPNFVIYKSKPMLDIVVGINAGEPDKCCPFYHIHLLGLDAMSSAFLVSRLLKMTNKDEILKYLIGFVV